MAFERACALDEVPTDEALAVTLGRYEVAVARHEEEVFAVENICSHAAVALSEGVVEDCTVECWLHGSRFGHRTHRHLPGRRTRRRRVRRRRHHPERSHPAMSKLEINDLHVSVDTEDGP